MSEQNFIITCWKKEQRVFNKNLAALKQYPGTDPVHDIRVAIKKIRATLELYVIITEEPLWEYPLKETEKLFSILGKQRDIEICFELINAFEKETGEKYAEFRCYLQSALATSVRWTNKAVKEYENKELAGIALLLLNDEALSIDQEELKQKLTGIISTHLAGCKKYYKQPHKLRQYLKEIYYWIKMMDEVLHIHPEYEKDLHEILGDFGNWQDLGVLEIKMKHFRKDFLPKSFHEYESVKTLELVVKEKEEKLLKATLNKTGRLLRKIDSDKKEKSEA